MATSTYIPVPVETEPVDLAAEAFDYIEAMVPGWMPAEGNLESWLIEALAQIAGELRAMVALVPDSIFMFYGSTVLGLPPYPAQQATALTTWTATDEAGYTVQAGTVIAVTPPATTDAYAFAVVNDFTIPPGQSSISGIECRALLAGADASGITGTVQVIDSLDFVPAVTLDAPTSGGADAETSDAYLDRLSALLTLLTPRPILPQDFAVIAQQEVPGVARAVAIDLYNPGPPIDENCPRCVTVVVVGADGQPCPPETKQAVDDLLQSMREVNFLVFVDDPTYATIDVSVDVASYPTFDPDDVASRVEAALASYLSPASWGLPPFGDTSGRSWVNEGSVRYLELATVVNNVDGVDYVKTLEFGLHGGDQGSADVALSGVAPLVEPGDITATADVEA